LATFHRIKADRRSVPSLKSWKSGVVARGAPAISCGMSLRLNPRHRILTVICLSITALLIALHWQQWFLGGAERASRDWLLTNNFGRRSPENPRIVFLAIDENTRTLDAVFSDDFEKSATLRLMREGFPFNRAVWAMVIERLVDSGAKAVVLDLVFPGPREGDDAFRLALERHRDRVVIGTNLVTTEQEEAGVGLVSHPKKHVLPTPGLQPPPDGPSWLGFVNVYPDEDFLVRRIFYRTTLLDLTGIPGAADSEEIFSLGARGLEKAGFTGRIPKTRQSVMFRYAEDFRPRSLHEIFVEEQWKAPPYNSGEFFREKIVLIGSSEQSSEDRLQTPFGVKTGPQIHLSAMNAALNRDFLTETSRLVDVALIAGGGILAWVLGAFVRRPMLRLLLLAIAVVLWQQIAQTVTNHLDIVPILLSPLLALTASGITWATWEQVLDRVERQRTRRALERYVSKDAVHEILDNPGSYLNSLGGVRKEITVLFSDVRGFTSLTEVADEQALVKQLNEYFEEMVSIVFANHGTLDKFIGDAVMAHWGSIVTEGAATDAHHAVTTVLQMRKALVRLNAAWRKRGIHEMNVGFGVNHGKAIVGNLGCEAKMEVSVIGDAVNLGSRLEGVTKQYKIDICLGEQVAAFVRESFIVRSVDLIVVKGKTKPVAVFTVIDKRGPGTTEPAWLARHEEAVRLYRAGDFPAAEKVWGDVLTEAPGDAITELFIGRCGELQKTPPVPPWTGVYEMKDK
jgi:adenylate cyclase